MAENHPEKINLTIKELTQAAESHIQMTKQIYQHIDLCKRELQTASFIAKYLEKIADSNVKASMQGFIVKADAYLKDINNELSMFKKLYTSYTDTIVSTKIQKIVTCFEEKIPSLKALPITSKGTSNFIDLLIEDTKLSSLEKATILKKILSTIQNDLDKTNVINQAIEGSENTLLMKAIIARQTDVAVELIKFGADVTHKVKQWGPLAKACFYYDAKLVYEIVKTSTAELNERHFEYKSLVQLIDNTDTNHKSCDLSHATFCGFNDSAIREPFEDFVPLDLFGKLSGCVHELSNNSLICQNLLVDNNQDFISVVCYDF